MLRGRRTASRLTPGAWVVSAPSPLPWHPSPSLPKAAEGARVVQEYVYVDMDDDSYKRADISRFLTDDEVKDVVGKLKRV